MSLSRSDFQNRPFEAVVKIVSHIKAGRGPLTAMRYIAEKSEGLEDVRPLYDEEGRQLKPEDFEQKLSEMPKPERKDGRQLAHIVVSFPKAARMTAEKTELFMQKYLEPFAERGFKFVYCSHVHQSAVHGHVLLCETNGRERLRFGKKRTDDDAATSGRSRQSVRPEHSGELLQRTGERHLRKESEAEAEDAVGTASPRMARAAAGGEATPAPRRSI